MDDLIFLGVFATMMAAALAYVHLCQRIVDADRQDRP
jgi:hypothetical protein